MAIRERKGCASAAEQLLGCAIAGIKR